MQTTTYIPCMTSKGSFFQGVPQCLLTEFDQQIQQEELGILSEILSYHSEWTDTTLVCKIFHTTIAKLQYLEEQKLKKNHLIKNLLEKTTDVFDIIQFVPKDKRDKIIFKIVATKINYLVTNSFPFIKKFMDEKFGKISFAYEKIKQTLEKILILQTMAAIIRKNHEIAINPQLQHFLLTNPKLRDQIKIKSIETTFLDNFNISLSKQLKEQAALYEKAANQAIKGFYQNKTENEKIKMEARMLKECDNVSKAGKYQNEELQKIAFTNFMLAWTFIENLQKDLKTKMDEKSLNAIYENLLNENLESLAPMLNPKVFKILLTNQMKQYQFVSENIE